MARPLKFSDPSELEKKIECYFQECEKGRSRQCEIKDRHGKTLKVIDVFEPIPFSVEGLADFLNCDPKTIRNYKKTELFSEIISQAMNRIHRHWIEKGLSGAHNAKITALCLAANVPEYRINNDQNLRVSFSLEDALRQINDRRQQQGRIQAPQSEQKVIDIE